MPETKLVIIIFLSLVLIVTLLVGFIVSLLFYYQKKRLAFFSQLEEMKAKFEQESLQIQLEMQEQTLEHISREIHDNIGQSLSLVSLHINTIKVPSRSKASQKLQEASELLEKSLDDLRDLSHNLTPEEIKGVGLVNAVERQVSLLRKTDQFQVAFDLRGSYQYLDESKEIVLFRILQESINNIIRHANASIIKISLEFTDDSVCMRVADNGIGFDKVKSKVNEKMQKRGRGLSNMLARARMIDADFQIESSEGRGSLISITAALNSNHA